MKNQQVDKPHLSENLLPINTEEKLNAIETTDRYRVICIKNTTNVTINYSYKWKDGSWRRNSLRPGRSYRHWFEYQNCHSYSSPDFYVKYDYDLSGRRCYKDYRLIRYRSPDTSCSNAKRYIFKKDFSRIEMYAKN